MLHNNSSDRFSTKGEIALRVPSGTIWGTEVRAGSRRHNGVARVSQGEMKCSLRAPPSHQHSTTDDTHHQNLATGSCCMLWRQRSQTRSDGWLQISEQLAASGKEQCIRCLIESSKSCSTFPFDCSPREGCCLISAYSHVLYYPALLQFPESNPSKVKCCSLLPH